MKKRRLLLIANQSLFGTGIISLLKEQKDQLVIEKAPDIKTALQISERFHPDVVVYFRETTPPQEEKLLQELISRYHTRVIYCTLEANHLTIHNTTRIENATVEDLMSAVFTRRGARS